MVNSMPSITGKMLVDTKNPLLEYLCQLLTTVFERCSVGVYAVAFRNLAVKRTVVSQYCITGVA